MSIDEVQEKHTYSQFLTWVEYGARRMNHRDALHYYFAQLTYWVIWTAAKPDAQIPPLEKFLIEFTRPGDDEGDDFEKTAEELERERQLRKESSKAFWKSLGGST